MEFIYTFGDVVTYRASDQIQMDVLGVVTKAQGMTIDVLRKDGTVQKVHKNRLKPAYKNIKTELSFLLNSIGKE